MNAPLKMTYLSPDRLRGYERNARRHPEAQLVALMESIKQFGFNVPILVDSDYTILAGHGRAEAARRLGLPQVPVVEVSHLSDRQAKAFRLADNRIALSSQWDFKQLSDELSDLLNADFDIDGLGFDEQELDALLREDAGILPSAMVAPAPTAQPVGNPEPLEPVHPLSDPQPSQPSSAAAPTSFAAYDTDVDYDYRCPYCKHCWSGNPK